MKPSNVIALVAVIITIGGILVSFGSFFGTTNTSFKFLKENAVIASAERKELHDDLGDIKIIMTNHMIDSGIVEKTIAKANDKEINKGKN